MDADFVQQEWILITLFNSAYFSPNKALRKLALLLAIYEKPSSSQHAIGRLVHLSSSMVNNYIKLFKREGLVKVLGDTNRTQSYHLTGEGVKSLRQSLLTYSAEIVQMYGSVKREIATILGSFYDEGVRTVVLFGAAETAEVVHAALKDTDLVMIGVVDSDRSKHGKPFNGLIIQSPDKLLKIMPDAIIITSFGRQEEIYNSVQNVVGDRIKIKRLSDINV